MQTVHKAAQGADIKGKRLHKIIEEIGNEKFLKLENNTLANLKVHNAIISTGGSAIFGTEAMEHLKKTSTIVYLRVPYEVIEKRLGSLKRRGVVFDEGQTLRDIYDVRCPLYEKYADITVECSGKRLEDNAQAIIEAISK